MADSLEVVAEVPAMGDVVEQEEELEALEEYTHDQG